MFVVVVLYCVQLFVGSIFFQIILSFPFPLLICFSFSRMRSKGSRFTLGVWGLRVCSLDVAFTSATVRKRSQPSAWGPYLVSSAEGVIFGGFTCQWRCFLSRDRRGTLWHSDVFCSASKVVLCGRRNIFATFSEDAMQQHFDVSIVILRGRLSTLDVSCACFLQIALAGLSGDRVQIPWQAWHFVRCAENWRKPRTKHRFWGSKLRGSYENS